MSTVVCARTLAALLAAAALAACSPAAPLGGSGSSKPATVQKLNICIPGYSQTFAHAGIAQQKGFFSELGLDVNLEEMQGGPCAQAVASGTIQFSGSPNAIDSTIKGLPYRTVFVTANRLSHQLVVNPKINGYADLKGGKLAISGPGGLTDVMSRDILQQNNLSPEKDVTLISIGTPDGRATAMVSGAVDGSLLSAQEAVRLIQQGFKTLPYPATVRASAPWTTNADLIKKDPDLVYRFVKGALMGHLFYASRKAEALPMILKFQSSDDQAYEEVIYDLTKPILTAEGSLSEQEQKDVIEDIKKAQKVEQAIPPADVFDFQFAARAYKELKESNWQGLFAGAR
jgi:ABC-type nitrate/sulfonate/bicarbonate transport system substrate-binding protein